MEIIFDDDGAVAHRLPVVNLTHAQAGILGYCGGGEGCGQSGQCEHLLHDKLL